MQSNHLSLIASIGIGSVLTLAGPVFMSAQVSNAPALTGQVSSAEEGLMEGVLVSARKEGSTLTTTVVATSRGCYSFPSIRVELGLYTISIRAIGYELEGPKTVEVRPGAAGTTDLKLSRTKSLVSQLSNGEWLTSLPGTEQQKTFLTMCVGCHTLQRVLTSAHNASEFEQVFMRMASYSQITPIRSHSCLARTQPRLPVTGEAASTAADFASVSLGSQETVEYPLKTLPRTKGSAPRVIITEYDLPRKEAQPHDFIVDVEGKVWYCDFGHELVGVMDPRTDL
jgi:hypothetical protein